MGRHTSTTPATPQARSRAIERGRRGRRVPLRVLVSSRMTDATAAVSVRARRAGVSERLARPTGLLASGALALGAVVGGVTVVGQQVAPAWAAESASTSDAAAGSGTGAAADGPSTTMTLTVDGAQQQIPTTAATLADALRDAGIVVHADDLVSAPLADPVPVEPVSIARVDTTLVKDDVVDAHTTTEVPDANLPKGERRVTTKGVDGVTQVVSSVTTQDGAEASRQEVMRVVASTRTDEVVAVGTKEPVAAPAPARAAAPARSGAPSADAPVGSGGGVTAAPASSGSAKDIAARMVSERGWGNDQYQCLVNLWQKESGWSATAANPTSSAYGIPQALPGSKMASAGADWRTNPATQISWGLGYISDRYGTPCAAWGHSQAKNWY